MTDPHIPLLDEVRPSWMYPIYIPSYSRAGKTMLLKALDKAKPYVQRRVHLVVRDTEADAYAERHPWAKIVKQKPTKEGAYGIGPARALCVRDAERRGYKRIVMMDDDIRQLYLLERASREGKPDHTRRHSHQLTGIPKHILLFRSLAVGCLIADSVFEQRPNAAYGAARNSLFSGDVDTTVGAKLNSGSFPACVMFIDIERFTWRKCLPEYYSHGEDLSMFLHTMSAGQECFTLPVLGYDQTQFLETTIPLDPNGPVARTPDLENAESAYPKMFPYLKATYRNPLGGVMRIGVNWSAWYRDTATKPVSIPLADLI